MKKQIDSIIVGQGLAGTVFGLQLEQFNKSFIIFDTYNTSSSSKAAAGLINPITGQKIVKSWKIDELLPFAIDFYEQQSKKLNIKLVYPHTVFRVLKSQMEENDWMLKSQNPEFSTYMENSDFSIPENLKHISNFGIINHAYRIDLQTLMNTARAKWEMQNCFLNTVFDYDKLKIEADGVQYQEISANRILFCEGATIKQNPYFNYLPILPNKGEAFLTTPYSIPNQNIIKNTTLSVPLNEGTHWLGGTSKNRFENELPETETYCTVHSEWQSLLQQSIDIQQHLVGIRPTTPDRRPMLGVHPIHSNLFLFNGLGTKGTLLSPYFSQHLIEHIFDKREIMQEVDIKRFEKKYWK